MSPWLLISWRKNKLNFILGARTTTPILHTLQNLSTRWVWQIKLWPKSACYLMIGDMVNIWHKLLSTISIIEMRRNQKECNQLNSYNAKLDFLRLSQSSFQVSNILFFLLPPLLIRLHCSYAHHCGKGQACSMSMLFELEICPSRHLRCMVSSNGGRSQLRLLPCNP